MFNLSSLDTTVLGAVGVEMAIAHPVTGTPLATDKGEPITITLLGSDAKPVQEDVRAQLQRRMDLASNGKRSTVDEIDDENLQLLVGATKGWKNIVVAGKPVEFSRQAAFDVYRQFRWIREQAQVFYTDRANFIAPVAES